ncbi:MAG: threonine--tRNA ligase [Candidatus Neomarinimicrobiota bacterium]|nr:MAG: threonine--tRNA ligase [Candidatus Neomarinimicrobiota bacterium]
MSTITLTLPDQSTLTVPRGTTALEVAESLGPRLAQAAVVAELNGQLRDLNLPLTEDGQLRLLTGETPEGHEVLLHSTAHLMAQAVKELFPEAKVTIGPAIENRFYYDFDIDGTFSEEDLRQIETRMKELAKRNYPVHRKELSRAEALELFRSMNESYKVEILEDIPDGETISAYEQGDFIDLCRGPHVPATGKIKYFKLLDSSGAYWRGDERNKMLQRIYGTVFATKDGLKGYLRQLEEAKKRDHRKLGKELELFTFDEEVGPGLPLWLPNGAVMVEELEALAKETERKAGYVRVRTPHLTKGQLYERSGHLEHYRDSMYPAMDVDGIEYYVKPMNCPHHHKIYASSPRSYRDLPLRLAEYGTCYRYEKSGQLFGLMRVRSMQMNDAHIYCTHEQFKEEFLAVCRMYLYYFDIFGIEKYEMRLSLHDPADLGGKYINEPELWLQTEQAVREALQEGDLNYVEIPGEAAFYGPKIDVQVWSAIGREFTLATNQVDFAIPARFDLTYTDEQGREQTPLCIHRAPLGTHERFIGFLIEHFGGDFPLWLAPVQVAILPISEKSHAYAKTLEQRLFAENIRVQLDLRPDKIGAKIRQAELKRIPVMLVVGEREAEQQTVSLRRRFEGDLGTQSVEDVTALLTDEIKHRRRPHRKIR